MNHLLAIAFALGATAASARELVVPVITGTVGGRIFSTTVQFRNPTDADVQCTLLYSGPERVGNPLRSDETIPARTTKIYEDFLAEIAAAGTVRVTCSGDVEIVTRLQDSIDGGQTFSDGRVYRPFTIANLIARGEERTFRTSADLVLAEMSGKPVHVEVVAKNFGGVAFGKRSYNIPPHAQRVVNLNSVRDKLAVMDVTITVTTGEGRILVGKESRDPALAKVARRRTPAQRAVELASVTAAASSGSSIAGQLLICPFKGASFREPATGLCFMRDRWYDPSTGTFLTPDGDGYRGSSNPYIYCGGDPVNCSDPTGRLGDGGDLREDFRRKERAEQERRHAIWCAQNPVECRKLDVRGRGMMRMLGGAGQTTAGAGAFLSTGPLPEPLTKTLGGTAVARGIDNAVTGAVELWTGTPRDTFTGRAFFLLLVESGMSPAQASKITGWTAVGVDVGSSLGSGVVSYINGPVALPSALAPQSRILAAQEIGTLAPAAEGMDTIVLGPYTIQKTLNGQPFIIDSEATLTQAARLLRGRTLTSYSRDINVLAPQIRAADRIIFYTRPGLLVHDTTAAEMAIIQSDPILRAKTIFVYGGLE
jgi:RHS repeat-associated protein